MTEQTVLITGCSSGIGMETALFLAEHGWQVHAGVRDPARGEALAEESARRGARVHPIELDVSDPDSVRDAVERIESRKAGIDALVNNAGINVRGFFEDLTEDEMRKVFDVNLFGSMRMVRAVLPGMRGRGRGRIVLMSSSGARFGSPASTAYCASKFSLEGFGESLAHEIAPFGIQVSMIEPGFIRTELFGRNRTAAAGALGPQSPYDAWYRKIESWTDHQLASAPLSTRDIAITVHDALSSKRPRLRYIVGRRTKTLVTIRRHFPEVWFDRLWARLVRSATFPDPDDPENRG